MVSDIRRFIIPVLPSNHEVSIYSKAVLDDIPYTANPRHGAELWKHEWAYFNIGGQCIACQLLCFIDVPCRPSRPANLNGSVIDERGSYAYVHCVHDELRDSGKTPYGPSDNDEGSLAHADQKIVHRMPKSHRKVDGNWVPATENDKATPLVLPLQSIIGPCLAVPDLMCKNT